VQAQTKQITGKVLDAGKESLIGVGINVKGTTQGVTTDVNGAFKINIPTSIANPVLVFKYLGFKTQEVTVGTRTQLTITLVEDRQRLDEVVIMGYGQAVKKSDMTAAVSVVSGADLAKTPVAN